MRFKDYIALTEQNTVGHHNDGPGSGFQPGGGAYLSSDQSETEASSTRDAQGHANHLPGHVLDIPIVTKTSRVAMVERNKNPILVMLQDGTKMYFTWDEFNRIQGETPSPGRLMTVKFQRRMDDKRRESSQIQSIEVR